VRLINRAGGRAVGLTGKDGAIAVAKRIGPVGGVDVGCVGEVVQVSPFLLEQLARDGFIPVIAPIACDAEGQTLNVNADPFAAKLAAATQAEKLLLLTDVAGVRGPDDTLYSTLTDAEVKRLIDDGVISGGMIPKVSFGLSALQDGVRKVHIVDGRVPHAILLEIFTDKGIGTELTRA
jgi:acetylglutamate kinase